MKHYSLVRAVALAAAFVSTLAASHAGVISEDFSSNPAARGWVGHGNTSLFTWNPAAQNLSVTWDSSKPNSLFALPLGLTLTTNDTFSAAFDLQLADAEVVNYFQLAAGFLNLTNVLAPGFSRGSGADSPNLVEFCYFPDSGFGGSLTGGLIDWTGTNWFTGGYAPGDLNTNDVFRVTLTYTNRMVRITVQRNGQPFITVPDTLPASGFLGFHVDRFSITSYSEAGQDPQWAGGILAHGSIDNVVVTVPPVVAQVSGAFENGAWKCRFQGRTGYNYRLERRTDVVDWTTVDGPVMGVAAEMSLTDAAPPAGQGLYRVQAQAQ